MNEPLVSIIMGVYNSEKTVENAIESIINQTYKNWEFIICDDNSKDKTYKILEEYEKKDFRIKILRNSKNLKLAASLNKCLKYSKGKYIARMDADDISLPMRLEKQVKFLETNSLYDVVGAGAKIMDGKSISGLRICKDIVDKYDVLYGPPHIHPTIMMKKNVYDSLKGYKVSSYTNRGQDWEMWFRFYASGYSGYNMQEPLIVYHESKEDYKKRTFKTAVNYSKIAYKGCKILKISRLKYFIALKPLFSFLLPEILKKKIRKEKL